MTVKNLSYLRLTCIFLLVYCVSFVKKNIFVCTKSFVMRHKYLLDSENLVFIKEEKSLKDYIKSLSKYTAIGTALALVAWLTFFTGIFESPESNLLNTKNSYLISEVEHINAKFDSVSSFIAEIQYRDDNCYRVISQIEPLPKSVRKAGFGGSNNYENLEGFFNSNLIIQSNKKSDILLKQLNLQAQSYDTVIYVAKSLNDSLLSVPAILPISPMDFYYISSAFGNRIHPLTGKYHRHDGIDYAANVGKPIYATGKGIVTRVSKSRVGYGNRVVVSHGFSFKTLYAHMNEIYVSKGDTVLRGECIGTVGNTGTSTGPHLHYEVIYRNVKRNPKYYYINDLSDREYQDMVKLFSAEK